MKITELIGGGGTAFSFEVLPPKKGLGFEALRRNVEKLLPFAPRYINITIHRSEYVYTDLGDGTFRRDTIRRRPGTVACAAAIQQAFGVPAVPHIVCQGFTKEEIEYTLLDLQFLGIENVLLLRGDKPRDEKTFVPTPGGYAHTTELQQQVNAFNEGRFLDGSKVEVPGCFDYGVACYPEKHEEAPNPEEDLRWFCRKVEMGASYGVTQLFYDNAAYFRFVERARQAGVTVPIIPGIKPFTRLSQLTTIPKTFHCDLPEALAQEALRCRTDEEARALGVEWGIAQCRELIRAGVPSLHFYSMAAADSVAAIAKAVY